MIRKHVIVLRLATACVALVVGGLLGETVTRLWFALFASQKAVERFQYGSEQADAMRYRPHPYLSFFPAPNFKRGPLSHNSLGFRGPEIDVHKEAGAIRIVAMGGSTTYTSSVISNEETFPSVLQRELRQALGKSNLEVVNAGCPDYTTWESLINFQLRLLELSPDLAIVYHNINDVDARLVEPSSYRSDNTGLRKNWSFPDEAWWEASHLLRFASRSLGLIREPELDTLIQKTAHDTRQYKWLAENPPTYFHRNLVNLIAVARANGVRIMLATFAYIPFGETAIPAIQRGMDEQNGIIRRIGHEHNVPVLDFAAEMPKNQELWADGVHLNERGANIKAKIFSKFIVRHGLLAAEEQGVP